MKPPLKLSAIEQEHLQELYDAAGVARDELPYTPEYDKLVTDFQDRTFKNGDPEQVYGAILKYARTSSNPAKNEAAEVPLTEDQSKQIKQSLARHAPGGKILPYSDAFTTARNEFKKASGLEINEHQFWKAVVSVVGSKRRPPPPRKKAAKAADDDDE
jgi:hypothetical protein